MKDNKKHIDIIHIVIICYLVHSDGRRNRSCVCQRVHAPVCVRVYLRTRILHLIVSITMTEVRLRCNVMGLISMC